MQQAKHSDQPNSGLWVGFTNLFVEYFSFSYFWFCVWLIMYLQVIVANVHVKLGAYIQSPSMRSSYIKPI